MKTILAMGFCCRKIRAPANFMHLRRDEDLWPHQAARGTHPEKDYQLQKKNVIIWKSSLALNSHCTTLNLYLNADTKSLPSCKVEELPERGYVWHVMSTQPPMGSAWCFAEASSRDLLGRSLSSRHQRCQRCSEECSWSARPEKTRAVQTSNPMNPALTYAQIHET